MSSARLRAHAGTAISRNGKPRAVVLLDHERRLLARALAELVEREGKTRTAAEVMELLERAPPVDVLRELELEEPAALRSRTDPRQGGTND